MALDKFQRWIWFIGKLFTYNCLWRPCHIQDNPLTKRRAHIAVGDEQPLALKKSVDTIIQKTK